ncbi:MAG TPA: hypothetical protein VF691_10385 [Cytophagaceae bacterium]
MAFYKKLEVVFQDRKPIGLPKPIETSNFLLSKSSSRDIYDITKYAEFKTMKETISEIIGIVKIRTYKDKPSIKVVDGEKKLFFKEEPLFIIDGVASFNNKVLLDLDPVDVKTIEVLHPKNLEPAWRGVGAHGIIDVHTKIGYTQGTDTLNISSKKFIFKGYSPSLPKCPALPPPSRNYPDFRTTLYWNPAMDTGIDGKTKISFFPNQNERPYYLVLKGVTNQGEYFEIEQKILENK